MPRIYVGTDLSYKEAEREFLEKTRRELEDEGFDEGEIEIEAQIRLENEEIEVDEPTIEGECEGVSYRISWLGGAPLLWVTESPYIRKFDLCSPCVPGACSLESPNPNGYAGYDVPSHWRHQDEQAQRHDRSEDRGTDVY